MDTRSTVEHGLLYLFVIVLFDIFTSFFKLKDVTKISQITNEKVQIKSYNLRW